MDALKYIDLFKRTPAWAQMVRTVEASPWHREANVAVHTEMVIDQYLTRFAPQRAEDEQKIALMALLFHDVGKPDAEEVLDREDGTSYRRYAGHEQGSAVEFGRLWLTDNHLQDLLTPHQAREVRFIIEHHLPYGITKPLKRRALATAVSRLSSPRTFFDVLRSDAAGRISDDHAEKLAKVEAWIEAFQQEEVDLPRSYNRDEPTCFLLVGPSGAGKSSFIKASLKKGDVVLSLDDVLLDVWRTKMGKVADITPQQEYDMAFEYRETHGDEYSKALQAATKKAFADVVKTKGNIFIDGTNLTTKRRAHWAAIARKHGLQVVSIENWITLGEVNRRQVLRPDKMVPPYSTHQHVWSQTTTMLGADADHVLINIHRQW